MPGFIAIVIGAFVGGVLGLASGAFAGAAIGWLLVRQHRQRAEIEALRQSLLGLESLLNALRGGREAAAAAPAQAVVAEPVLPTGPAAAPPRVGDRAVERPLEFPSEPMPAVRPATPAEDESSLAEPPTATPAEPPAAPRPQWRPLAEPAAAPAPDALAPVRAWLFGGNTIVKAGVAILFLGLAFLAKYASEHVQVPVEVRLAGIGAVALVLLVLGWRLRLRRPAYAQVLQGGSVAVLYLTLFVAFRYYGVLAVGPVFALLAAVAVLSAALAVQQDSLALAVLGALGGFAAPLLVSSGSGNVVALFAYYLVLDLGIAAVAWVRTWRVLNLIGFAATFLVATSWGVLRYRPADYATGQVFLIAFFLVFIAILLMPSRRAAEAPAATDAWVQGSLLFGLPTITFVLQHGLVRDTAYGTALSALALAAFYVALAWWARHRALGAMLFESALAIATVFLTLVIPFALDAGSTAGAWALEGAALVWIGYRQARWPARAFGLALLVLSGGALAAAADRLGAPTSWLNATFFNGLLLVAAALATAWFVHRAPQAAAAGEPPQRLPEALAEPLLIGWAVLWAVVGAGWQIDALVPAPYPASAWLVAASLFAALFTLLAWRLDWPRVGLPALGHAPALALGVMACAAAGSGPLDAGGAWAWPLALAAHLFVLRHAAPRWPAPGPASAHALGVLVLAAWGALEGRTLTSGWGDLRSAWAWLGWLAAPALLLLVLSRPAASRRWPVSDQPWACRSVAGGVLAAGALAWTLLANLASDGGAQPLPHLPLLNPLDLGVGVALLAAGLWWRSDARPAALAARLPALGVALLSAAGFVWLNAMLVRGFHHYGGVPWRVDAWIDSLAVQTGLTLLWSVTALVLMWLSARRALRTPWMVGAALLGAVVLKLLLVDLSGSGTVTRIVSFIGVGVLMLVIGYVAPLPSAHRNEAAA